MQEQQEPISYLDENKSLHKKYKNIVDRDSIVNQREFNEMIQYLKSRDTKNLPVKYANYFFRHILLEHYKTNVESVKFFAIVLGNNLLNAIGSDYSFESASEEYIRQHFEKHSKASGIIIHDESKADGKKILLSEKLSKDLLNPKVKFKKLFSSIFHEVFHLVDDFEVENGGISYKNLRSCKEIAITKEDKNYYDSNYNYTSPEVEVKILAQICAHRYLKQICPNAAKEMIRNSRYVIRKNIDYRANTLREKKDGTFEPLDITFDKTIIKRPSLLNQMPILKKEYHSNGTRRTMVELLIDKHNVVKKSNDTKSNVSNGNNQQYFDLMKEVKFYNDVLLKRESTLEETINDLIDLVQFETSNESIKLDQEKLISESIPNRIRKIFFELSPNLIGASLQQCILTVTDKIMAKRYKDNKPATVRDTLAYKAMLELEKEFIKYNNHGINKSNDITDIGTRKVK